MNFKNLVFAGTPDFAATSLNRLIDQDFPVTAVYTQPDRKSGRGQQLQPSPVKAAASGNGIPVFQPANFKAAADVEELRTLQPDLMIVVAYGLILPRAVLDIPTYGCINVHASLLPRWRGAAPIQRAIMAGDTETGVTIMQMEEGLDTGDMLLKNRCPIEPEDTGSTLHDKLACLGADSLVEALENFAEFSQNAEKQDEKLATYAKKLDKATAQIDWQQTAPEIHNHVRGLNSWPVAQTTLGGKVIRVWQTETGEDGTAQAAGTILPGQGEIIVQAGSGVVRITRAQLPGKKPMEAKDLLNGYAELFKPGQRFD